MFLAPSACAPRVPHSHPHLFKGLSEHLFYSFAPCQESFPFPYDTDAHLVSMPGIPFVFLSTLFLTLALMHVLPHVLLCHKADFGTSSTSFTFFPPLQEVCTSYFAIPFFILFPFSITTASLIPLPHYGLYVPLISPLFHARLLHSSSDRASAYNTIFSSTKVAILLPVWKRACAE